MRQLATLPTADAAQTLADHLQGLRIETRLERLPDGWALWVLDEDRLAQARQELAEFSRNPADPRFAAARQAADATRRRDERRAVEEAAAPRPEPAPVGERPRPGPWTFGLMVASCLVYTTHTGYLIYQNGGLGSTGAVNLVLWGETKDLDVWVSPAQQALSIGSITVVDRDGHYIPHDLQDIKEGQLWRLVTPIFLHFGLVHLLFNMTMLWQLGAAVEQRRGAGRYLLFVFGCAVASNLAQYYLAGATWESGVHLHPSPLFGGMSGVLYGLFGYVWMKARFEPALGLWLGPRTVLWMIVWLFLCMTGALGPIGNVAHVTGLLFGVVIGVAPHLWRRVRGTRPT